MRNFAMISIFVATLGVSSFALADNSTDPADPSSFDLSGLTDANSSPAVAAEKPAAEDHGSSSLVFGSDLGYSLSDPAVGQGYLLSHRYAYTQFDKQKSAGIVFGGHAGYRYAVTPSVLLGVESGYLNFGKSSISSAVVNQTHYDYSVKAQVVTLLATVDYRIADHYDIFAKFGPALVFQNSVFNYSDTDPWSPPGNNLSATMKIHKIKPFLSVGTGYAWNQFEFSVAYDRLFGDAATGQDVQQVRVPGSGDTSTSVKSKVFTQSAVMGSIGYALPI